MKSLNSIRSRKAIYTKIYLSKMSSHTNNFQILYIPHGVYGCGCFNIAIDFINIHIRCVSEIFWQAMVLFNDGIKHISKHFIRILVSSIDSTMLIIEFYGACNGFSQGKSRSLCLNSSKFSPFFGGDMFSYQAVCGLDVGKWSSLKIINDVITIIGVF